MNLLKQASIFVLNLIFPQCCLICGKICNRILCKNCKNKLEKHAIFKIEIVKNKNFYFDKQIYIFNYENDIRNLILDYKFHDKSYLYQIFAKIIIKNAKIYGFFKKYDIITSIPIHKKRKKQRGYNQSELISKEIAKNTEGIEFQNDILIKIKNTVPQSLLNKAQRQKNVQGAYKVINEEKIKNKKIILFDDIYTTGNTVNECAKILKANGAKEVLVLTVAKD